MPQDTLGRYTPDLETRADAAVASAARLVSAPRSPHPSTPSR